MSNHCVEDECHECGYYVCVRCGDSGMGLIPSGPVHDLYLKDKEKGDLKKYKKCPRCNQKSMR